MNRLDCLIAGALLLAPCSCQREAPSAAGEPATEPVMTIDESLQQYGLELMRKKEGVLLATDPATGAVLACIVKGDRADSLRLTALAERFSSEAARGGSPDEVEDMWRDVNGAPGTGPACGSHTPTGWTSAAGRNPSTPPLLTSVPHSSASLPRTPPASS